MIKKVLVTTLLSSTLFAQNWFSATSISFGAKYLDQLDTGDKKIEQFFIHKAHPKIYYKIGVYEEQLTRWKLDDGTYTQADTATSVLIGVGYNLLTLGHFFIDGGLSLGYRFDYRTLETFYENSLGTQYNLISDYSMDDPVIGYLDLGIGFALGSFTIRADISATKDGSVKLFDNNTQSYITEYMIYKRVHLNLGIAYWW